LDRTENGTAVMLYDLIFAQSNNLFPVQSSGVMQGLFTDTYPPLKVPSASASAVTGEPSPMVNAWLFYQEITADPSSTLAQEFVTTCNNAAANATGSASLQTALNGFFQGTKGFENVTGTDYILVQSYLSSFAYAWAEFEPVYLYYLTNTGGSSASSSAGGIVLSKAAGAALPIDANGNTDANAGYQIAYYSTQDSAKDAYDALSAGTAPSSTGTPLYFASQQLVSDLDADIPAICLQLSYASPSTFTNEDSDWGTVVPVLGGTVDGQQVAGVDWRKVPPKETWEEKAKTDLDDVWGSWWTQFFMAVTGLLMGIMMVAEGIGWLAKKFKKAEATAEQESSSSELTDQQVTEVKNEGEQVQERRQEDAQDTANKLDQDVKVPSPADLPSQQQAVAEQKQTFDQTETTKVETAEQKTEENELQNEATQIEDNAQIQVDQNLETEAGDLKQAAQQVEDIQAGTQGAQQALETGQQNIASNQQQITTESQQDSDTTAEQIGAENRQVEEEADQIGEAEEKVKETEDQQDQQTTDKNKDDHPDDLDDVR
jgi:hypothetical protein